MGHEKTPSTITQYGRDISNKIPISSKREKRERDRKKGFFFFFWKASGNGRQSHSFLCRLVFFFFLLLSTFLHSKSPLILELHKWDLQNRLTPFISSLCHYTCSGFEAAFSFPPCRLYVHVYVVEGRRTGVAVTSDFRAGERHKPSKAKSKLHPHGIQSSICTQSTRCRPNTAEGDENSVPGMT